ncbi:hypothetical protein TNCV_1523811 [Trichonephila clavipes]|nr:hypothetical protein TNCV_1523811 [Trichonephila clavipes]
MVLKSTASDRSTIQLFALMNFVSFDVAHAYQIGYGDGCFPWDRFIAVNTLQSIHLETMTRRKGLSPDKIANLLRKLSENESAGGQLSCSNLDSDEDIGLSESYYLRI